MKRFFRILPVALSVHASAQSLDVDQTSQFLKPRMRIDARYFSTFNNSENSLHFYEGQTLVSAPIHTTVESNLGDVVLDGFDIRSIMQTKIRFSQQMVSARIGYRHLFFDTTMHQTKDIYSGSLGFFGIQSLKKLNILFYSVNASFSESAQSLPYMRPGFSALIGDVKIKSLKKYYVYGLFMGYIGQRFVAVPFFGANLPLKKHHYFNFVFPAYVGYNYSKNKVDYSLNLGFDGARSGLLNAANTYTNLNMGVLSLCNSFRYKIKKGFWLRVDAALMSRGTLRFRSGDETQKFNLPAGYYATAGIHYNFGSSAIRQINLLDLL